MAKFPFAIVGFDLDGTLVDSSRDLGLALNHALELAGKPPVPLSEVAPLIGGGAGRMLRRALQDDTSVDEQAFQAIYRELLSYYEANIAVHTRPYPGCEAMLDGLATLDVHLAVVTNKFERFAHQLLAELGMLDRFATVIGGDTLGPGRNKPSADPVLEMIARCGGGKAAFVGDTTVDVGAARAAGIPVIAVSFGFNDRVPGALGADAVIDHFDELHARLASIG